MSKCQKNKYYIGTSSSPRLNKDFNNSLSKLMAARDAQDSRLQAKPESVSQALIVKPVKNTKSDIDLILEGDF
jgi:hypothetical protein